MGFNFISVPFVGKTFVFRRSEDSILLVFWIYLAYSFLFRPKPLFPLKPEQILMIIIPFDFLKRPHPEKRTQNIIMTGFS